MATTIQKYIYALFSIIVLLCSCDPLLVPQSGTQAYEEDANGHKYVDLGLSVKWAAYDIGAKSAAEHGSFFAWGETQAKGKYSWENYKYAAPYKSPESGTRSFGDGYGKVYELTKYNLDPNSEYYDGKTTLELMDDAAHMAWGGNWRMPTVSECNELVEKCEWTWTEYLGVYGYDVKGPNGNRMFWPYYMEGIDMLSDRWLSRWSSNCLNNSDIHYNPDICAYMMTGGGEGEQIRSCGLFVRAVWGKKLPKFFILSFDANGGEGLMHPQQFNKDVLQSIDSVRFTNDILNFAGWNTEPDGSGTAYTDQQEITLSKDLTLYAQWEQKQVVSGSENGYDYVDLGLPSGTLWATCNVGATSPEGYGDYFAWGETAPKDEYSWSTYKYCNGSETSLTKYCDNSSSGYNGFTDNKTTLELTDDAARVNWGGKWRMPTTAEQDELQNNCTWTWTTQKGINGCKVTSKTNGNSIFLPAAGYRNGTSVIGSYGYCWSSSLDESDPLYAYGLFFYLGDVARGGGNRYGGHTVRAVISDDTPQTTIYTLTFNANGGSGTMSAQTFEEGVSQALAANTFTRSGYTFIGWNTAPDGSGTSYTDGQEITLSEDLILYAQWKLFTPTYVDLGLSVKWATCNIGATAPEGYGDYFAWGETSPKDDYDWSTYKYCNGSEKTLTKYCNNVDYGYNSFTDDRVVLEPNDDAAHVNWGGEWRMPTAAEMNELVNNCSWVWTQINGVNGQLGTSKINGNTIFLPAAGKCYSSSSIFDMGKIGCYWQSNLNMTYYYPNTANFLYVDNDDPWLWNSSRYVGYSVRAVFSENDTPSTFVTLSFDANGGEGTMAAQTFEAGVSQAIAANTFTRSGYAFTGWNTNADGSGTSYTDGQEITLSQDITLYAQWKSAGGSGGGSSTSGTENGHEWVDLGLPSGLKWAISNVGATTPDGYGDYFAWGETSPKNDYSWSTYKYCNGSETTLTKYNTKSDYGTVDNKTTLDLSDDAARTNWGGKWRMPTKAEQDELRNNCTWTWTTQNGVNGYKVTSKTNGNSIFLPAAGYRNGTSVRYVGSDGGCWPSLLDESHPSYAYYLYFNSGRVDWLCNYRYRGRTVRAVFSEKDTPSTFVTLSFNANGGEGTMAAQYYESGVSQAIAANAFKRSGYTFTGWNTAANGSGTSYTDKQSITLSQDITLYAQWKKDIVNYTVTFNANGGTGTMAAQTFEAGISQAIAANAFTRSGYTFTGWNTSPDGSGNSYTDKQSIVLTQDMTLYAQWEVIATTGYENGYEWVDLGLPSGLKWATCNIGATTPEGYGEYFAWGEIAPKDEYSWATYKYCNGSETTLTKYNTNSSNGTVDNKTTLDLSDDAARANWGGKWRMHTQAEKNELIYNCTWTWTTQSGVNGYKVTSKTNGNSIFLPAAGFRSDTSVCEDGSHGLYWSSSLCENYSYPHCAYIWYFYSGNVEWNIVGDRSYGHPVRAVCP